VSDNAAITSPFFHVEREVFHIPSGFFGFCRLGLTIAKGVGGQIARTTFRAFFGIVLTEIL
jgi:hypothetical protein